MVAIRKRKPFALGEIVSTRNALSAIESAGQSPLHFLLRHLSGDWGEVSPGDAEMNDDAIETGGRIHSAYRTSKGVRVWVITDAGHACTTLLLPEEY